MKMHRALRKTQRKQREGLHWETEATLTSIYLTGNNRLI